VLSEQHDVVDVVLGEIVVCVTGQNRAGLRWWGRRARAEQTTLAKPLDVPGGAREFHVGSAGTPEGGVEPGVEAVLHGEPSPQAVPYGVRRPVQHRLVGLFGCRWQSVGEQVE